MSIESELFARLKNDATVNSFVGTRIYPLVAVQNVIKPYITFQVINDNSNQCIEGTIFQNDTRFQIDIWSTKYSEVKAIKQAVLESITGFKSSNSISNMDDYEDETKLYRQLIDFKLKG